MNIYLLLGEVGLLILTVWLYKRRPRTLERRVLDLEGMVNRQVDQIFALAQKVKRLESYNEQLIREGRKLEAQVVGLCLRRSLFVVWSSRYTIEDVRRSIVDRRRGVSE
jgi:hypothetical protein